MKYLLVALVALTGFAYVKLQEPAYCKCALFVSSRHAEWMIFELPDVEVTDCVSHDQCKNRCVKEVGNMTNDLDLFYEINGNQTVGEYFCQELYSNFIFWMHNVYVHGYYQICGGPWEYTGQDSQQMLCCNGGHQEHCVS